MVIANLRQKHNLCPAEVLETKYFYYHKETNSFSQDISSLPIKGISQLNQRIYNDACDTGFWLKSEKTGYMMLFMPTEVDITNDNEIAGWNFKSEEGMKLLVVND